MLYFRWDEVAPLLRGMYARQQDGFGQEQPQPATESPTFHSETMAVYQMCIRDSPEETRHLMEQLSEPAFRQTLKEEYAAFWTAYQQDRDLLRFHYHRPREIWENLKALDLPRRTFSSELSQVPRCV